VIDRFLEVRRRSSELTVRSGRGGREGVGDYCSSCATGRPRVIAAQAESGISRVPYQMCIARPDGKALSEPTVIRLSPIATGARVGGFAGTRSRAGVGDRIAREEVGVPIGA